MPSHDQIIHYAQDLAHVIMCTRLGLYHWATYLALVLLWLHPVDLMYTMTPLRTLYPVHGNTLASFVSLWPKQSLWAFKCHPFEVIPLQLSWNPVVSSWPAKLGKSSFPNICASKPTNNLPAFAFAVYFDKLFSHICANVAQMLLLQTNLPRQGLKLPWTHFLNGKEKLACLWAVVAIVSRVGPRI